MLFALMILALPLAAEESLGEGLFIPDSDVATKVEVSDGEIIHRQKAKRLKPERITFRQDTEDKVKFWLEMEFSVLADPGDFYVFLIRDQTYSGFVVRGAEQHGCRWALGIQDRKKGKELFRKIGKVYDLPEANIEDKTQGDQSGAVQPATKPADQGPVEAQPSPSSVTQKNSSDPRPPAGMITAIRENAAWRFRIRVRTSRYNTSTSVKATLNGKDIPSSLCSTEQASLNELYMNVSLSDEIVKTGVLELWDSRRSNFGDEGTIHYTIQLAELTK